ncbi:hypothetical protein QYM36_018827 [Artemia franciscana]|uniref:Uncharacterized protein n=1 Tax=Artemia franciscana TaxID=6661 RepID=A0AA88H898_ARTSF|nr:hypothetical protein QYM36_018827 [Artemia franciscana]
MFYCLKGRELSFGPRGSGRSDINNAKLRPYLNTESRQRINGGKISGENIRGQECSGFSRGTDILEFKIGRRSSYFNIGERERMNRKSGFRRIPDCKNSRERPYLIRGQADQMNGDSLRDKQTKGRGGLTISGGRLSNKETRGRGSSGLSRGSDMLDLNISRGRLYFNIKGRGRSGFSKGSTMVDLKNGRGSQYSNKGKEEPMNRSSANNQETIEAAVMTIEPLIAEIKHLQKRVEITLKERNHCREEIEKIIYKGDIYELLHLLCHECIKYMMHTENSLNDSEIFGYIKDIKEISLISVFKKILKGYTYCT